jgi:DNA repair exonuclease SbcCD ATPase subunit
MPRTGITAEQIAQAAEALVARNLEPTMAAVREELGGTGSFSTIGAVLRTWRTERAETTRQLTGTPVPDELQGILTMALGKAWAAALAAAEANLNPQREALAKEKQELEASQKEFEGAVQTLEGRIENLEELLKKAEEGLAKTEAARDANVAQLLELSRENGRLQEQLGAAKASCQQFQGERDAALAQNETLAQELGELKQRKGPGK